MQARQRTSVSFAVHAVDRRLETEAFADAYRRMAALAESLFEQELEKAAA